MNDRIKRQLALRPIGPVPAILALLVLITSIGLLASPLYPLAFLPALALLAALFLFLYQRPAYLFLVFLFPFRDYITFGDVKVIGELSIQKFLGFWLFIVLGFMVLFRKKTSQSRTNFWPWLLIFFLINGAAALLSPYPSQSYAFLYKMLTPFILFVLTLAYIDRETFVRYLPRIFVASVFLSFVWTIVRSLGSGGLTSFVDTFFALGPNAYSIILVFPLPLLAHRCVFATTSTKRLFYLLLILVNVSGVILVQSRGGTIIMLFSLAAVLYEFRKRFIPIHLGIMISACLAVLVMVMFFVPSSYWERQKTLAAGKSDLSISARASYITVAFDSWRENPIFGTGPGTFIEVYKKTDLALERHLQTWGELGRFAHNTYLEVLVGAGTLGALFYLAIILLALQKFHQAKVEFQRRRQDKMASLVNAYRLSFLVMLISYFLISDFFHHYFWISLALSQAALTLSATPDQGDAPAMPDPAMRFR